MPRVSAKMARAVAECFLQYQLENPCGGAEFKGGRVARLGGVFYLSEQTKAYEFLLVSLKGNPAGYVLVSGDTQYPPILEHANSGKCLSHLTRENLRHYVRRFLPVERYVRRKLKRIRLYYCSPLDIIVEMRVSSTEFTYIYMKDRKIEEMVTRKSFALRVRGSFNNEWNSYETGQFPDLGDCKVLRFHPPSRYQQTCRPGGGNNSTYCGPDCISGCTAVAWATLASSFRTYDEFAAMQVDDGHFRIEWDTYEWYRPADEVVDSVIWGAHGFMATNCVGSTDTDNAVAAGRLFERWGYQCQFATTECDVTGMAAVLDGGFTIMGHAHGVWIPGEPIAGHSFVVYGYDTRMFGSKVFICFGWGYRYPDKWVDLRTFTSVCMTGLVSYRPLFETEAATQISDHAKGDLTFLSARS